MNIFTPNSKSLPQQVDANTKSIENLTKMCPRIYHARTEIDISSTTTLLSITDVDTNAMDNAILIAQNATIFKINGKGVDDSSNVILYIEFICTMVENKGDKGDTGETGATGLPALECSYVYKTSEQPLLDNTISIYFNHFNRIPEFGDMLSVSWLQHYSGDESQVKDTFNVTCRCESVDTTINIANFVIKGIAPTRGDNGTNGESALVMIGTYSDTSSPANISNILTSSSKFNRDPIEGEYLYFYWYDSTSTITYLCHGQVMGVTGTGYINISLHSYYQVTFQNHLKVLREQTLSSISETTSTETFVDCNLDKTRLPAYRYSVGVIGGSTLSGIPLLSSMTFYDTDDKILLNFTVPAVGQEHWETSQETPLTTTVFDFYPNTTSTSIIRYKIVYSSDIGKIDMLVYLSFGTTSTVREKIAKVTYRLWGMEV